MKQEEMDAAFSVLEEDAQKVEELETQVLLDAIQKVVNETKKYLIAKNIKNISPIVYLLNTYELEKIKLVCDKINLSESDLIASLLETALETEFTSILKETLITLLITKKVTFDKIKSFIPKEEHKFYKSLEDR